MKTLQIDMLLDKSAVVNELREQIAAGGYVRAFLGCDGRLHINDSQYMGEKVMLVDTFMEPVDETDIDAFWLSDNIRYAIDNMRDHHELLVSVFWPMPI